MTGHTAFRFTQFDPRPQIDITAAVTSWSSSFHAESPVPPTLLL